MKNREDEATPQLAKVDIGDLLYSRRQEKGMTIQQVSEKVKLSPRIIEQLEMGHFEEIGTGVYVRGYLSAYAKCLDLDTAKLIGLYNEQYPEEAPVLKPTITHKSGARQQIRRHSKVFSFFVSALVFAGLVFAYAKIEPLLLQNDGTISEETPEVSQETAPDWENNLNTNTNVGLELGSVSDLESESQSAGESISSNAAAEPEAAIADVLNEAEGVQQLADEVLKETNQAADAALTVQPVVLESAANLGGVQLESLSDESSSDSSQNSQEIQNKANAKGLLNIRFGFKEECWVRITDAKNKVMVSGTFPADKLIDVTGKFDFPLTIKTWRPKAIKALKINQQPVKLRKYKVSDNQFVIRKLK